MDWKIGQFINVYTYILYHIITFLPGGWTRSKIYVPPFSSRLKVSSLSGNVNICLTSTSFWGHFVYLLLALSQNGIWPWKRGFFNLKSILILLYIQPRLQRNFVFWNLDGLHFKKKKKMIFKRYFSVLLSMLFKLNSKRLMQCIWLKHI